MGPFGNWFNEIPSGTYIITESADGMDPITSDAFQLLESGKRVRIINYFEEGPPPTPKPESPGSIYGLVLFCDNADRVGDVDFIISFDGGPMSAAAVAAAVTPCDVPFGPSGVLMLYPFDLATMEIDEASGELIPISLFGNFSASDLPSGYYALGYVAPDTGDVTISRPFAVDEQLDLYIEINIFSAVMATGFIDVYKDFCVDPARVGEVAFQVNAPDDVFLPTITKQATASTECRFSNDGDGSFDFTLTNLDTGRTWTETLVGGGSTTFAGVPTGTYTLTESHEGNVHTSAPFSFEATLGNSSIYVRNFIAERDWEPGDINEENADVFVDAYVCVDVSRDGGAEYFHFGPVVGETGPDLASGDVAALDTASSGSTAECREATEDDGLQFSLVPADGAGDPIPFSFDGNGSYYPDAESVPSGDYLITEATTGVSTGILRLSGHHYLEFLKYEPLPPAEVTVNASSADPAVADTLPDDATWTVSQNGVDLFSDTFAAEHLQLPVSLPVSNPIAYGSYDITVSAGPTFAPFTQSFTVDQPTEVFEVVLTPVAPAETIDVIVTLMTVDGGDLPTGTEVCLQGAEYDVCWALDAVAGRMIAAAAPSGTTVTFPTVPIGTYELSVPANAPYLAYSETIQVPESSPYAVTIVLQRQDVTPTSTPTEAPGTPTPTATVTPGAGTPAATATATATSPVTGLPSTGNGAGGTGGMATTLLARGSVLALIAAVGLAWNQHRTRGVVR
jgi:hypothetical protein